MMDEPFDGPEESRVLALRPVVAHHEVLAFRDGPLALSLGVAGQGGRRLPVDHHHVGLLQPHGGSTRRRDEDAAVLQGDGVARQADDALDERHAALLEAIRRLEDDDVAAVVVAESRRELVDQDVLVLHDGREHRVLLDFERLRDEVVDQEVDDEREDQRLDDLEQTSEASTRAAFFGARTIVGGRVGGIGHRRSRLGAGRRRVA